MNDQCRMEELVWTELKCRRVNITKTKTHWKVLNSSNERCVYFIFCHLNTSSSASWRTWGQRQRVRVVCNIYGHNLRSVRAVTESLSSREAALPPLGMFQQAGNGTEQPRLFMAFSLTPPGTGQTRTIGPALKEFSWKHKLWIEHCKFQNVFWQGRRVEGETRNTLRGCFTL